MQHLIKLMQEKEDEVREVLDAIQDFAEFSYNDEVHDANYEEALSELRIMRNVLELRVYLTDIFEDHAR